MIPRLIGFLLLSALAIVGAACLTGRANAHDWYPRECCSDRDCRPVPGWKQVGNNFVMPDGTVIPWSETREGRDEDFHLCVLPSGTRLCAFRPLQGS